MRTILKSIKKSLKEISPFENIRVLGSNPKGDILAGITVAIIALPLALAFGEISKLGPIAGIWGAIAGGIFGGFFGGCMVGVSGPTAPKAAQIAAFMSFFIIGTSSNPDLVAAFSIIFISGLILVIISILRISRFIHYTPYPVIAGFMCGIGVIVILTQLNAFVGLGVENSIIGTIKNFQHTLNNYNREALFVSLPSILVLFFWDKVGEQVNILKNIPAPLFALVLGTAISQILQLDIPYIGDKMSGADSDQIFTFYLPDFSRFQEFIMPAVALAGLAILDSLLSCKVADNLTGLRHSSDRETFGQGMANMGAGIFGGVTTATATMRTVANIKFGGKTPLASIVHGVTLLAILLGLSSLVALIPTACLAAILFKVGIEIMDYRILPILKKIPKLDMAIFFIVLFITVFEDLMVAISVGGILAVIGSFNHIRGAISKHNSYKIIPFKKSDIQIDQTISEILNSSSTYVIQPIGTIFFGTIEPLLENYSKQPNHETLIIDMQYVKHADLTGAFAIEDLCKVCKMKDIKAFIVNEKGPIQNLLSDLNISKAFRPEMQTKHL